MHERVLQAVVAASLLLGCEFGPTRSAGGGSDIGNGGSIAGLALTRDGAPAAGVTVRLRPAGYLAPVPPGGLKPAPAGTRALDTLGETRASAEGGFSFARLDTGAYRLEILDEAASQGALVDCRVEAGMGRLQLPETRMAPTGEIRIRIPGDSGSDSGVALVRIYGLERIARLNAGTDLIIKGLAAGTYALNTVSRTPRLSNLEGRAIQVDSDSSTLVDNLNAPCDSRACDSTVIDGLLKANGLPGEVGQIGNASGRITGLVFTWPDTALRFKTLAGLRRLNAVKTFRMDGPHLPDSLAAPLMEALANMDSLWFLRLSGSGDRAFATVPASIGRLTALTQLYLMDDSLALLPDEIGNLKQLEMLFLRGNRLARLPATLGRLTALKELHAPFNRLDAIPDPVLQLPRLIKMDVFGNRLCALTDAQKARLQALGAYPGPEGQTCP